jgi:DNA repair exonuclease SbcCD ATPase subunit
MATTIDHALQELAQTLEAECTDRTRRLRDRIADELTEFEAAVDNIDAELEALDARISKAAAQLESDEAQAVAQIESHKDRLSTLLQQAADEVDACDEALLQAEQGVNARFDAFLSAQDSARSKVRAAAESIADDFHSWVATAQQGFGKADESLEALNRASGDFTEACARSAQNLVSHCEEVSRTLDRLTQRRVNDWNQAEMQLGSGTRQLLVQQVAKDLQDQMQGVQDVLGVLRSEAGGASTAMAGDVARLIGSLREVASLLRQVEPLLRIIDELA